MSAAETPFRYRPIAGQPFKLERSDGTIVNAGSREGKDARAAGLIEGRPPKEPASDEAEVSAPKPGKRPVGRPRKTRKPAPDESPPKKLTRKQQAVEYGMLAGLVFSGFAAATGRRWYALEAEEERDLGDALSSALPTLPGKTLERLTLLSPWLKLAMVSGRIIARRVEIDNQYAARMREEAVPTSGPYANAPAASNGAAPEPGPVLFVVPPNVKPNGN